MRSPLLALALASAASSGLLAQGAGRDDRSGADLYRDACLACHGQDGRGAPRSVVGFAVPLPDFADCSFATREPDPDWLAIMHEGGPVRGFDRLMPAFGQALAQDELERTLAYVRGFCAERSWPPGDLNLPRPLVTEKAYPEDEAVLSTTIGTGEAGSVGNEFLYERRFGARSQLEVVVPVSLEEDGSGSWQRGLGDVAVAVKHVLFHSRSSGTILSGSGEIVLPTGKETLGLGKGVTIFEPFATFGQILPRDGFLQAQGGFELSTNHERAGHEAFWRVALGKSFVQNRFGRTWSPMVEFLAARELESGEPVVWDLVPQVQVTLSRRQHIMINAGVRMPLNERGGRSPQVLTYFLWDWFDGGLFDGWR
jgi:mono/diheme cytochrome c family protein